jgi:hypothetical protein
MHDEAFMWEPVPKISSTLLYGIEPRGLGTGDVESLFSHLLSLAHAHSLGPDKLVRVTLASDSQINDALTPNRKERRIMRMLHDRGWGWGWGWDKDAGKTMIGTGDGAKKWAHALELATGVGRLDLTTLGRLSSIVSTTKLVTSEQRVCLACINADIAAGKLPYERLLWRMGAVRCCPIHESQLVSATCSGDKSRTGGLSRRLKHGGVCGACGSIGFTCLSGLTPERATTPELWRAKQCHALLAGLVKLQDQSPEHVKVAVRSLAETRGGMQEVAARAGAPKSIISRWLGKPKARISLEQLLDIASAEGVSFLHLVRGEIVPVDTPDECRVPQRKKRKVARVDHSMIKAAMEMAVAKGGSPSCLAKELNVDYSTLAQHEGLYRDLRRVRLAATAKAATSRHQAASDEARAMADLLLQRQLSISLANAGAMSGAKWYPSSLKSQALRKLALALQGV